MRLWHYRLIPYLDRQRLLGQWREVIAIKRKIDKCGTPNMPIVNYVMSYSIDEYKKYCGLIITEMHRRNYKISNALINEIYEWQNDNFSKLQSKDFLFEKHHNNEYLTICYYNLKEKYLCGMIDKDSFNKIEVIYNKESKYGK